MRAIMAVAVALLLGVGLVWAANDGALEEGLVNPGFVQKPEWFKASFLDLREDVAEAAADGKRVMLYFYQDGCPYCEKLINTNFAQRDIAARTRENFDVIAVNMWGDNTVTDLQGREDSEKQFSTGLRVQFTPTILFLDEQGKVVLRVNGYYPPHKFMTALDYVAGHHEDKLTFSEYLTKQNPVVASGKLHREKGFLQPPHDLRRKAGDKPLLVLFEQKECPACDEMHADAFPRKESRDLLAAFDVALIDIWDKAPLVTPSGKRLPAREWAQESNVQYAPSLLFFDDTGAEVFRTEAYLRPFHLQSAMAYVASGAYKSQPEFQRFVQERADRLREQGHEVDLWR